MRDKEVIDSELRLLAAVRWPIREHGGEPSSRQIDELLDERNKLTARPASRGPRGRRNGRTHRRGQMTITASRHPQHGGPPARRLNLSFPGSASVGRCISRD
jgi:hypothetical protein